MTQPQVGDFGWLPGPNAAVAGVIRTQQNWIGGNDYNPCGADFVPPPPEEVPRLLADLREAINDDRLPPLVQAALVHAQFETIHPFADGNGRTGRALVQVIFKRRQLAPDYLPPISVVLATARERYIAGLTKFRGNEVAAWAILDVLPAHPVLTAPAATAATQRSPRSPRSVYDAIEQLVAAGVLIPLSASRRNRAWEAEGLLDLIGGLESGVMPTG